MNGIELEALLAKVQGYDNRELTEDGARAWAEQLARVPYALAAQAVALHFREHPGVYLTPGHVYQGARKLHEEQQREVAVQTRQAAEERSEEIRRAALERKAAEAGTRVATDEEAKAYGKGMMDAIMAGIAAAPRMKNGRIPKGAGVAAAHRAMIAYQEERGRAPIVERRRQPCAVALCTCTHEEPCEAGWVPVDPGDPAAAVEPCRICKPRTAAIVENAKGDRRAAQQLAREQGKKDEGRGDEW